MINERVTIGKCLRIAERLLGSTKANNSTFSPNSGLGFVTGQIIYKASSLVHLGKPEAGSAVAYAN